MTVLEYGKTTKEQLPELSGLQSDVQRLQSETLRDGNAGWRVDAVLNTCGRRTDERIEHRLGHFALDRR